MVRLLRNDVLERAAHRAARPADLAAGRDALDAALLRRARHLPDLDRRLVTLAWRKGATARDLGELLGLNHGNVVRKIQKIRRRLCDPMVVALADGGAVLPPADRDMALAHHLRRESLVHIAVRLGVPLTEVRRRMSYVTGWVNGRRDGARVARVGVDPDAASVAFINS